MEIIPLYRLSANVLVGLESDFAAGKVTDGLVVEIDIKNKVIKNSAWSLQKKLKFGYYETVGLTERKTLSEEIENTFDRTTILKITDLLLNPEDNSVDTLVWLPERLKR